MSIYNINADEWKYFDCDIEYNDDEEEILIIQFNAVNEDNELFICFDPDVPLERNSYDKGIIQIYKNDHTYIERNMCTEDDIAEIYKLLDIAASQQDIAR